MSRRPHFLEPLLGGDVQDLELGVDERPAPVATSLEPAFDSASRKKGLLGRSALASGVAIVIAPSSAVHTFGMRFPIDIIFAGRDGTVLKIRHAVPRTRVAAALKAFAVIEMAAGSAKQAGLAVGDRLSVRRP